MRKSIVRFLCVVVALVCLFLLLAWAGRINTIEIVDEKTVEPQLLTVAATCLDAIKGHSLWTLSEKTVDTTVKNCDETFRQVRIKQQFPQKLRVEITMFSPVVKIKREDSTCILFESSAENIELSAERCSLYKIPTLGGKEVDQNAFVQEYVVELTKKLSAQNIVITHLEYKGNTVAPWYELTLEKGGKAYFPSSASITDKVVILSASLKGLYAAKERYSIVDVRFDRVYYK